MLRHVHNSTSNDSSSMMVFPKPAVFMTAGCNNIVSHVIQM